MSKKQTFAQYLTELTQGKTNEVDVLLAEHGLNLHGLMDNSQALTAMAAKKLGELIGTDPHTLLTMQVDAHLETLPPPAQPKKTKAATTAAPRDPVPSRGCSPALSTLLSPARKKTRASF